MKIIGLGKAGCRLTQAFSKFPQYETVKIDTDKDADITIKKRANHERSVPQPETKAQIH